MFELIIKHDKFFIQGGHIDYYVEVNCNIFQPDQNFWLWTTYDTTGWRKHMGEINHVDAV
jgi:hypothetical protein